MAGAKEFTRMVWREEMTFDGTTTMGHHIVVDALPPAGSNRGPKPVELLLTALAGCTAMDVLSILKKKREPVEGLEVLVEGTRAVDHPRSYTEIQVTYLVRGRVNPRSVERAIELSENKYCGVHAMLSRSAHITSRYEITDGQTPARLPAEMDEPEHISDTLP